MAISDDALTAAFSSIFPSAASFWRRSIALWALAGAVNRARNKNIVQENMCYLQSGFEPPNHNTQGMRFSLARFRIFLLRFLFPELDERHHRYHRFFRREARVPAIRPNGQQPMVTDGYRRLRRLLKLR